MIRLDVLSDRTPRHKELERIADMPVIDRRGKRLPPTHPFAAPRVVFGQGRLQRPAEVSPPDAACLPLADEAYESASGPVPRLGNQEEGGGR